MTARAQVPQARTITIVYADGWQVFEGERSSGPLSWDEMLGQIASMTMQRCGGLFGMRTPDEWSQWRDGMRLRAHANRSFDLPRHQLQEFVNGHGLRAGLDDALLPKEQQPDEDVRIAMRLLECGR